MSIGILGRGSCHRARRVRSVQDLGRAICQSGYDKALANVVVLIF